LQPYVRETFQQPCCFAMMPQRLYKSPSPQFSTGHAQSQQYQEMWVTGIRDAAPYMRQLCHCSLKRFEAESQIEAGQFQ
jgi:hypothetical protein